MIGAWSLLLRKTLLDLGRTPWLVALGEGIGCLLGLAVYWFTSRALGPALNFGGDYFTFVVVGETALLLPLSLWSGAANAIRSGVHDGTLELWRSLPLPVSLTLSLQTLALVPRDLARLVLYWSLAAVVFGLREGVSSFFSLLAVQCLALPLFLGLGLMGGALLLVFRRGLSILAHGGTLASVLAGAFFPLSVLPASLQGLSRTVSPFTWVLEEVRLVLAGGWTTETIGRGAALFGGGLMVAALGLILLQLAFGSLRRRDEPLVFTG